MNLLDRITHNPEVTSGKPCIRGLRVTVGTIIGLLASGHTADEILAAYPYLEAPDIKAALAYAALRTEELELPLLKSEDSDRHESVTCMGPLLNRQRIRSRSLESDRRSQR